MSRRYFLKKLLSHKVTTHSSGGQIVHATDRHTGYARYVKNKEKQTRVQTCPNGGTHLMFDCVVAKKFLKK